MRAAVSYPCPKPMQAPEAVANKAIKAAAARLEREEMASSPTHSMRKRDEGGLASAVQASSMLCAVCCAVLLLAGPWRGMSRMN